MTDIFRYLIGEFNGEFIQKLHNCLNTVSLEIKYFLSNFKKTVFKLPDEKLKPGEVPITEEMLNNFSIFTGVFRPTVSALFTKGSLRMVEPDSDFTVISGGKLYNYSERGLLKTSTQTFKFIRKSGKELPSYNGTFGGTDITTEATPEEKATMVPEGAEILGYLYASDVDYLDDNGDVILDKLHSEPAAGEPYSAFYGNQYLRLSESYLVVAFIGVTSWKLLLEAMQKIRYNGPSLGTLLEVIGTLFPDKSFQIVSIATSENTKGLILIKYRFTEESKNAIESLGILRRIIEIKYKQVIIEEAF